MYIRLTFLHSKDILKQKLSDKVEGKETVLNNNMKNRHIDLT